MDQVVTPFDWVRMFVGDQDLWFMVEILFRTVLIYIYTYGLIRWIGGRSISQLSLVEFLLVIALGSAVGDSLFYPDVPLLHAMLVITVIVLINKGLDLLMLRSHAVQLVLDGAPSWVVHDGRLRLDDFADRGICRSELLALLRLNGVSNLGDIQHAFLEPNGQLSVFSATEPKPGLPIVPPHEIFAPPIANARLLELADSPLCCVECGGLRIAEEKCCQHCGRQDWTDAVMPAKS